MNEQKIETSSELETRTLASKLARLLKPGDVITLNGELGSGKTTFTKGIASGLGILEMVTSPTFTIVKEYDGELPLYHMDAYRLEHSEEDIGFSEYFYGNGISVVEWAQFIKHYLPPDRLDIEIKYIDENSRLIIFKPQGDYYKQITAELLGFSSL